MAYIFNGTSVAVNCFPAMSAELLLESLFTIHMRQNDGLENYVQKTFFFFLIDIFASRRFCITRGSAGVGLHFLEAPLDPGGITCMYNNIIIH